MRGSPFDDDFKSRSRRSTTFGGQIDTQRGLLNKESLTLPKFLANTGEAPTIDPDDSFNKHRLDNVSFESKLQTNQSLFRTVRGMVTRTDWMDAFQIRTMLTNYLVQRIR